MDRFEENRTARRFDVERAAVVWHEPSRHFYSGRSVNISADGALLKLPLSAPIRMDETVDIRFPSGEGDAELPTSVRTSKVVRVNRPQAILEGQQLVAIEFL